jgi:hypothetical protein
MDEVDNVTYTETRLTHEPVGKVAEVAAEQKTEEYCPRCRTNSSGEYDNEYGYSRRDDGEDPGRATKDRECGTWIANKRELQNFTEYRYRLAFGEVAHDQYFGPLIEKVDAYGNERQYCKDSWRDPSSAGARSSVSLLRQNR